MQSPHGFIVAPLNDKRYDNTRKYGEFELIVSTSEEDHKFTNRFAVVKEVPIRYTGEIKKGDILVVHHNVFKIYFDIKGKRKSGKSYLKEGEFLIDFEQFFMYKNETGWHAYDKYCFVKPVEAQTELLKAVATEQPLVGIMKYPNQYLKSKGVNSGDKICFVPDSEYGFNIDGEKLYRMFDHQIVAIV